MPLGGSPFPPIADYAFLSDCETTALVAPSGNVEWMCMPRMDSPSVFGAMLDRDAGMFRLAPTDARVPAGQRYIPGTNMLETTWGTRTGWVIVRDVLLSARGTTSASARTRTAARRPTTTPSTCCCARCAASTAWSSADGVRPDLDYGRVRADWEYSGEATTRSAPRRSPATT